MIKSMIVTLSLSVAFDCQSKQFASPYTMQAIGDANSNE